MNLISPLYIFVKLLIMVLHILHDYHRSRKKKWKRATNRRMNFLRPKTNKYVTYRSKTYGERIDRNQCMQILRFIQDQCEHTTVYYYYLLSKNHNPSLPRVKYIFDGFSRLSDGHSISFSMQ